VSSPSGITGSSSDGSSTQRGDRLASETVPVQFVELVDQSAVKGLDLRPAQFGQCLPQPVHRTPVDAAAHDVDQGPELLLAHHPPWPAGRGFAGGQSHRLYELQGKSILGFARLRRTVHEAPDSSIGVLQRRAACWQHSMRHSSANWMSVPRVNSFCTVRVGTRMSNIRSPRGL